MKTTLKQENILSKVAENIRVIVVGKRVAKENQLSKEYLDEYFPIAKVSNLSIEDEFLKHTPQTERQKKFKKIHPTVFIFIAALVVIIFNFSA